MKRWGFPLPLSPPPLSSGVVVPHDHQGILDGDDIIRRISDEQCVTTAAGTRRISSIAFQPSRGPNGGMSIDIRRSIEEAQLVAADFVTTPKWIGSVVMVASVPRSVGLMVGYDPLPENAHHGEVWGKFDRKKSKHLQRNCCWFVPIPNVALA